MNKDPDTINQEATHYLLSLRRISTVEGRNNNDRPLLLYPEEPATLFYLNSKNIRTHGLGDLDKKERDLLQGIEIINALERRYKELNVLMPRTYAESLDPIVPHISVQAIILSKVTEEHRDDVGKMIEDVKYDVQPYDKIWIDPMDDKEALVPGKYIYIMNRRIGGWDGSRERPVIELLGGGGHLPMLWDAENEKFKQQDPVDGVIAEFEEELGFDLQYDDVELIGGFHNETSRELVMLCLVFVPFSKVIAIQNGARHNYSENIDGIYLGTFDGVMADYHRNAYKYAGGEKTKASNFPSQTELLERIKEKLYQ
jgi:hypothetical protein